MNIITYSLFIINEVLGSNNGLDFSLSFSFALGLVSQIFGDLSFDLSEVLWNVLVSLFESLFGEFSNLSGHHALLVLEQAVGASEEAIKGHDLLEEPKFWVFLLVRVALDGLFNGGVDLSVNLRGWEGLKVGIALGTFAWFGKGSLDHAGNFLDVFFSWYSGSDSAGFNGWLLLNSKYQSKWYSVLCNLAKNGSGGFLCFHDLNEKN